MVKDLTRAKLIQIWFAVVIVAIAFGVILGAKFTTGTVVTVLALCLAPPAMVLLLWPGVQPPTAAEVIRGVDRRA